MIQVDKIITISLEGNHKRQKSTQRELEKLALETEFYLAKRDVGHEERGCFNSHLQVCQNALQDELCSTVLVLEDDVKILPFTTTQIDRINLFLKQQSTNFDVLYLGLIISKMWYCGTSNIVRATGSGAHAYILSRSGMQKLAAYQFDNKPIDKVFKHDFICYSVYPIIAEQHSEETLPSAISVSRNGDPLKDQNFWRENYRKQKWQLWKNLHKTLLNY